MRGRGAKGKLLRTALIFTILFIAIEINIFIIADAEYISYKNNQEYITVVDKSGGADYTTIQEAINNAPEDSTIYVKIGTYNEIININKKITLIGENKDKTIINPISEENKYAIRVRASQVIIKNLNITNRGAGLYTTGIKISASKTQIEDCNVYDTPVGIVIWTSNNIINNCNFWGCKDEGIALMGTPYSNCENNKISNCIFHNNCDGIELQYSSNNTITNCEFYENTHTGIDAIISSNDRNIVSNCKIYNNEVHGIYLSSSSDNQIIDCTIADNNDGNIIMTETSQNNQITKTKSNTTPEKFLLNTLLHHMFFKKWQNLA